MSFTMDDLAKRLRGMDEINFEVGKKSIAEEFSLTTSYLTKKWKEFNAPDDAGKGTELQFEEIVPGPEPVDGAALLLDLARTVSRYVIMPEGAAETVACWVLAMWNHDCLEVSPILLVQAPTKGSGKSTLLDTLIRLVPRPLPTSHTTTAALFRSVEKYRPSLLIDEADSFLRDNEDMRGLINSGHIRATARVLRTVETRDGMDVKAFSSWCPKAIAGIGTLPATLQDRGIVVKLQRKKPGESVERLRTGKDTGGFRSLRERCATFAAFNEEAIMEHETELPPGLDNRKGDNWAVLLTVADLAGGGWPQKLRDIALSVAEGTEDDDLKTTLLRDIREIFDSLDDDKIKSKDLIEELTKDKESVWYEFRRGNPITSRQLGKMLKDYEIESTTHRFGESTAKGYLRKQFEDAWSRYLNQEHSEDTGNNVTNESNSNEDNDLRSYGNVTVTDAKGNTDPNVTEPKGNSNTRVTPENGPNSMQDIDLGFDRYPVTDEKGGRTNEEEIW